MRGSSLARMNIISRLTDTDLRLQIEELGPWFHNLRIGGIETAHDHFIPDYPASKFAGFAHVLPADMTGMSVLDIGCNAGFYAMETKRRGAARVVAIDSDARYLRQAAFAAAHGDVEIEFRQMSVYEIGRIGEVFDLVIFMGVLYHLRHPLLALDLIREHVLGDRMLFQSLQRGWDTVPGLDEDYPFTEWAIFDRPDFPRLNFIENRYAGDCTNWFFPNRAGMEAMLRTSGFAIEENPEREVYMCRTAPRPYGVELPKL